MFDKIFGKKSEEESTEETVENQVVSEGEIEPQKTDEKIVEEEADTVTKRPAIEGPLTFYNLVDWFGDKKAVAGVVNVDPLTVSKWRKRGVPKKYDARFREAMK